MKLTEQRLREIIKEELNSLNEANLLDGVKKIVAAEYDDEIYDETNKGFSFDLDVISANVNVLKNGKVSIYSTFEPFNGKIKKAEDIYDVLRDFEEYYDEQNS